MHLFRLQRMKLFLAICGNAVSRALARVSAFQQGSKLAFRRLHTLDISILQYMTDGLLTLRTGRNSNNYIDLLLIKVVDTLPCIPL